MVDFSGGLKVIIPKSRRLLKEVAVSQEIISTGKNSNQSSPRIVIHPEPLIRRCGLTKTHDQEEHNYRKNLRL